MTGGEDAPSTRCSLHRVDRGDDEVGLVAHDVEPVALRQLRLQALEALLHAVDHLDRVRARLLADLEHDGGLAVDARERLELLGRRPRRAPRRRRAPACRCGSAITMSPKLAGSLDAAVGAQASGRAGPARRGRPASATFCDGERARDVGDGQVEAGELRRVGHDVDLARRPPTSAPGRRPRPTRAARRSPCRRTRSRRGSAPGRRPRRRARARVGVDLLDRPAGRRPRQVAQDGC